MGTKIVSSAATLSICWKRPTAVPQSMLTVSPLSPGCPISTVKMPVASFTFAWASMLVVTEFGSKNAVMDGSSVGSMGARRFGSSGSIGSRSSGRGAKLRATPTSLPVLISTWFPNATVGACRVTAARVDCDAVNCAASSNRSDVSDVMETRP